METTLSQGTFTLTLTMGADDDGGFVVAETNHGIKHRHSGRDIPAALQDLAEALFGTARHYPSKAVELNALGKQVLAYGFCNYSRLKAL